MTERGEPLLHNMSAPPRSVVTVPLLKPRAEASSGGAAERRVPVGPGGGETLSGAVCLAYLDLLGCVSFELALPRSDSMLREPLGIVRALVAVALLRAPHSGSRPERPGSAAEPEDDDLPAHPRMPAAQRGAAPEHRQQPTWTREAGLARLAELAHRPEHELLAELVEHLERQPWPAWVPPVAFVRSISRDVADRLRRRADARPHGVQCPLLAARLTCAMRGPVFLRGAAPALSGLIDGTRRQHAWAPRELWLPVRPGSATPIHATDDTNPGGPR
jgi:hypothetical protein